MTTANIAQQPGIGELQHLAGKYLTFVLQNETYGMEILKVQEIIGLMAITRVPRTPTYIRGVINLRGKVIPVIELRQKFLLESAEDTEKTCIIVVQIDVGNTTLTMGLLVDEVSEVLDVLAENIEPPPNFGSAVDNDFLLGIGKQDNKVIMLLDVNRVLGNKELVSIIDLAE